MVERNQTPAHLAHVRQDANGAWSVHALAEHLAGTGKRAEEFAEPFENGDWAFLAGILHDFGKYSEEFQARIKTKSGFDPNAHLELEDGSIERVDHSTAGALHAVDRLGHPGRVLAYLISGHHAGLPDWNRSIGGGKPLAERLNEGAHLLEKAIQGGAPKTLLDLGPPASKPSTGASSEHLHLWIRMLFSCLVDADFLDTESFMEPGKAKQRGPAIDLADLKRRLDAYLDAKAAGAPHTPVNRIRQEVLIQCRAGAAQTPGLFSLTVPTGGGKTLASMAFALEHALAHGKQRIVVVIPYTSIIEQTSKSLGEAFGDPSVVLEHHSNLDPDQLTVAGRLAAENWDAPIIVTTNVQFFESLHAAKPSVCRKLHNLVNSVVIFDEAQMLPPDHLRPILSSLHGLTRHFGVSALLCTATQPALNGRIGSGQCSFDGLGGVRELVSDPAGLAARLKRVELRLPPSGQSTIQWPELAQELRKHTQVLCVVNTRRDCRALHAFMPEGTIHLSALMCAEHRSIVIREIKARLASEAPIRVISTQLVEAGVDLDFPVVYRAMAGLDSIAQAAGRCNREGRLNAEGRLGEVVVFNPPASAPPGLMFKGEQAFRELLSYDAMLAASLEPDSFTRYFELFYSQLNTCDAKDMRGMLEKDAASGQFQFRTAAKEFHLIDDEAQRSVVVWYGPQKQETQRLLETLKVIGPSRERLRKLQRSIVSIPERAFRALADRGEIQDYGGIWGQAVDGLYDPMLGLLTDGVGWNPEGTIL